MLERDLLVVVGDRQTARRVPADVLHAAGLLAARDDSLTALPSGHEIQRVRLGPPPREELRLVGDELGDVEAHELRGQRFGEPFACAYEDAEVLVLPVARRRLPASLLHLPRLHRAVAVRVRLLVRLGLLVVPAALGAPLRLHRRVERPVRDVYAPHLLDLPHPGEVVRAEPERLEPDAEALVGHLLRHTERDEALGANRVGVGRLGQDLRRPTERALRRPLPFTHIDGGPAILAADRLHRRAKPALGKTHAFLDRNRSDVRPAIDRDGLLLAAVIARHRAGGGVPGEGGSAARTGESLSRCGGWLVG